MLRWRNFRTEPPYDAYEDDQNGLETDYVWAFFVYRYKHRPYLNEEQNRFTSWKACKFSQGIFESYESHMKTSPYPEDKIEVLAWIPREEVEMLLKEHFRKTYDA